MAIADFDKALLLKPDFKHAYDSRGVAHADKGFFNKAIEDFTEALKLDDQIYEAYYNRGNIHYRNRDYTKAIADYTAALRLKPDFDSAKRNLARALEAQGGSTEEST